MMHPPSRSSSSSSNRSEIPKVDLISEERASFTTKMAIHTEDLVT